MMQGFLWLDTTKHGGGFCTKGLFLEFRWMRLGLSVGFNLGVLGVWQLEYLRLGKLAGKRSCNSRTKSSKFKRLQSNAYHIPPMQPACA